MGDTGPFMYWPEARHPNLLQTFLHMSNMFTLQKIMFGSTRQVK